jgi:hypothetical protein
MLPCAGGDLAASHLVEGTLRKDWGRFGSTEKGATLSRARRVHP